jgi:hypothetical protein
MASIIGASGLLTPDIYGDVQQGFKDGQGQRNSRILAQYGQSAVNGDQNALSQIYQSDPSAGMRVQQQSAALGEQQKSIADKDLARLGQHARLVTALADAGDTEGAANLYKTIYPEASKILGPNLPANFDPSMVDHMRQIANAADPQTKKDLINLTPGSSLIDPATGKPVYSQPAAAPNLTPLQTSDGYATFNPKTGSVAPLNYASGGVAQPPVDPMDALLATANQRVKNGENPDTVQADLLKQAAAAPGVQVGAGQRVMPKPTRSGNGAPSGYRYTADGNSLEVIPGGPADKSQSVNQGLNDDALHNAAWSDILTGKSGITGYSKEATAQRAQVANIKAQIAKDAGVSPQELATTQGRNKALQASLTNLQKQSDVLGKTEETFRNNADLLLTLSDKVSRTGAPALNKLILNVKNNVLGDPDAAAFAAARNVVAQE